ncbi:MAG: LON peptidase substrate-binding domain-containing protein, partial [Candidatus Enteromonas sp.]|nr:LON peptidase substrate-binding domain-containing protein [Candidatus Enteromonas sp.]
MNEETMTPQKKTLSLPLLITRGLIVFPNMGETIEVGRAFSMAAVDEAKANTNSLIFVVAQRDAQKEDPAEEDLFAYGTLCRIINYVNGTNSYRIRVVGSKRVHFLSFKEERGVKMAEAEIVEDVVTDRNEEVRLVKEIISAIENSPAIGREIPRSAIATITKGVDSATLADNLAGYLPITIEEKEAILEEASVSERLKKLLSILSAAKSMAEVDQNISEKVRINSEKAQKEYFLREKMKAIKEELGEGKDDEHGPDAIKSKLEKNPYPENVKAKVKRELKRFEMMPESSLEASLIMSYIDTLLAAPWYQKTEDNDDLNNVRKILDEDHFGLEKVKKRIIEYLAVKKMTGNLKAPILCFYGPPGTGKTSLAKSIARALDRKFFKASLGGVSDESEIRGHRRTYVGSMPGRIIQGMTKSGVTNPVFLLDEIDKVGGSSLHGDPSSALLEVLDPEQNFA